MGSNIEKIRYTDFRDNIKSGDLLVWPARGFLGKTISLWTKSKYTHVGIVWKIGNRILVLESIIRFGVRIVPLSAKKYLPVYHIPTNARWTRAAEEYALKSFGEKYSVIDLLGMMWKRNPLKSRKTICTEYFKRVLNNCPPFKTKGWDGFQGYEPGNIVDYFLKKGSKITLLTK